MLRLNKDILVGLLFFLISALFLLNTLGLSHGTWRKIGPATFPTIVAMLLAIIGAGIVAKGVLRHSEMAPFLPRPRVLVAIIVSIILFGLLYRGAGLLLAVFACTVVASFATQPYRFWTMALYGLVLGALCSLVFVVALGVQAPIIGPWFIR